MDWNQVLAAERILLGNENRYLQRLDEVRADVFSQGIASYDAIGFPVADAKAASTSLIAGLTGRGPMPNYGSRLVGLAYLTAYQLQHVLMAACFWYGFLKSYPLENGEVLYVMDFASGVDAGLYGFALARHLIKADVLDHQSLPWHTFEPGRGMVWVAELWGKSFPVDRVDVVRLAKPDFLPYVGRRYVRVMTAFHPHLDYGANVPPRVRSDFRAALYSFKPDFLLLSAHISKKDSLGLLAEEYWAENYLEHIPEVSNPVGFPSPLGEEPYNFGFDMGVQSRSRFDFYERMRFGFPKDTYLRFESDRVRG